MNYEAAKPVGKITLRGNTIKRQRKLPLFSLAAGIAPFSIYGGVVWTMQRSTEKQTYQTTGKKIAVSAMSDCLVRSCMSTILPVMGCAVGYAVLALRKQGCLNDAINDRRVNYNNLGIKPIKRTAMPKSHKCHKENPWRNFRIKKDPMPAGIDDYDAILKDCKRGDATRCHKVSRVITPGCMRVNRIIDMRCGL